MDRLHRLIIVMLLVSGCTGTGTTADSAGDPGGEAAPPQPSATSVPAADERAAHTAEPIGTSPPPTADATREAATAQARATRDAASVATTLAAIATPLTLGPWRSSDGAREAWVEAWPCPADAAAATAAESGKGGREPDRGYERLMVRSGEGEPTLIDSQLVHCSGLGGFGLEGHAWSGDGTVFFYTQSREGGPDGLPCGCCPGLVAWREGVSSTLGPFVLSPKGTHAVRFVTDDDGTAFVEVSENNLRSATPFPLPEGAHGGGWPTWSPDGRRLALPDWPSGCGFGPSGALALHVEDGRWQRTPALDPEIGVMDLSWETDAQAIRLYTLPEATWRWDLETGELTMLNEPDAMQSP
jgi:hypothetical protein